MPKKSNSYYHSQKIASYNAIFNFIISNRNYGKTWGAKKRAVKRAIKKGKKTIWIRTFKKEVKECVATFFKSRDLCEFCDLIWYDKETKKGNLKQIGNTFYIKRNKKWIWFLKVFALSDYNAIRSSDDVDIDTIVYDESTMQSSHERYYRGNRVDNFIDAYISIKREHKVKCFFFGNKENVSNPFLKYFAIKELPSTWEGIRTYRDGSIAYEQINNLPCENNSYDKKLKAMLAGTRYGSYLYSSKAKNEEKIKQKKVPSKATLFCQLSIDNYEIAIKVFESDFYIINKIDRLKRVFTLEQKQKYKNEQLLVKRQKRFFIALENALSDNRIYYDNIQSYNTMQTFYKWLGC